MYAKWAKFIHSSEYKDIVQYVSSSVCFSHSRKRRVVLGQGHMTTSHASRFAPHILRTFHITPDPKLKLNILRPVPHEKHVSETELVYKVEEDVEEKAFTRFAAMVASKEQWDELKSRVLFRPELPKKDAWTLFAAKHDTEDEEGNQINTKFKYAPGTFARGIAYENYVHNRGKQLRFAGMDEVPAAQAAPATSTSPPSQAQDENQEAMDAVADALQVESETTSRKRRSEDSPGASKRYRSALLAALHNR